MAFVMITCQCGHQDDFDNFTMTQVFGSLPPGYFQCPKCRAAWARKEKGYRVLSCDGAQTFVADRVEVVRVEARL